MLLFIIHNNWCVVVFRLNSGLLSLIIYSHTLIPQVLFHFWLHPIILVALYTGLLDSTIFYILDAICIVKLVQTHYRQLVYHVKLATNSAAPLATPPVWLSTVPHLIRWSACCAMPNALHATKHPPTARHAPPAHQMRHTC
mgnify:CR=1 FL=1